MSKPAQLEHRGKDCASYNSMSCIQDIPATLKTQLLIAICIFNNMPLLAYVKKSKSSF